MTYTCEDGGKEYNRIFDSSVCDIQSPVILDLPTGTGKTLACLPSSLLFSVKRKEDILGHGRCWST